MSLDEIAELKERFGALRGRPVAVWAYWVGHRQLHLRVDVGHPGRYVDLGLIACEQVEVKREWISEGFVLEVQGELYSIRDDGGLQATCRLIRMWDDETQPVPG